MYRGAGRDSFMNDYIYSDSSLMELMFCSILWSWVNVHGRQNLFGRATKESPRVKVKSIIGKVQPCACKKKL